MTLETFSDIGWPRGSCLSVEADEIPDGYARYIQDGLLDIKGSLRKRGPLTAVVTGTTGRRAEGLAGCYSPNGTFRLLMVESTASGTWYFEFVNDALNAVGVSLTSNLDVPLSGTSVVDIKPALGGGVIIGQSYTDKERTDNATQRDRVWLWRGSNKTTYTGSGAVTVATTQGSATVTGVNTAFSGNVEPGMFLFINTDANGCARYAGTVKAIGAGGSSNVSLTLEEPCPFTHAAANTWQFTPIRAVAHSGSAKVTRGYISCSNASATVNGSGTKFKDDIHDYGATTLAVNTWDVFKKDGTWIGVVNTVSSATQLTLNAAAAVSCVEEEYYALPNNTATFGGRLDGASPSNTTSHEVGILNTTWQQRQFYANKQGGSQSSNKQGVARMHYTDTNGPDNILLNKQTGTYIDVPSVTAANNIKAILGTENSLMVFKEDETYAMTGSGPSTWRLDRVLHDGCISTMGLVPYENGCVWPGKLGLYRYDGRSINNLLDESLGPIWQQVIQISAWATRGAWGFVERDHYFLTLEAVNWPAGYGVMKAGSETRTGAMTLTLCVNLLTGAVTFLTNMFIKGAVRLPVSAGGTTYYLVQKYNGVTTPQPVICSATDLLSDTTSEDGFPCQDYAQATQTQGPSFYMESKKYDMGDELLKKVWRELMLWHWNESGTLTVETVLGLGNNYTVQSTTLPAATAYTPDVLWFGDSSQLVQFRVYETSTATTRVKLGAYAIRFKKMRLGRV